MRFAYAGIDFLGDVFKTLVQAGWEPVKLFTRPCDGIYDFNEDLVAQARQLKLPIQLSRLRPADLKALSAQGCEALVVAGYPWLIKGWEDQMRYALNIHPSPLPVGRGPYPLYRAILDQHEAWGVTAHALAPEFDTGAILSQATFAVSPDETHESLLARCQMASRQVASELAFGLPSLWSNARPQGSGSYWPMSTDRDRTLDWSADVASILRTVRAYGLIESIAQLGQARVYVSAATGWSERHDHPPGTLVHTYQRHMVIAARDGFVQLTRWSPISLQNARTLSR